MSEGNGEKMAGLVTGLVNTVLSLVEREVTRYKTYSSREDQALHQNGLESWNLHREGQEQPEFPNCVGTLPGQYHCVEEWPE